MSGSRRRTVAVVGAGFSGLLTTLRLLADPDGPQVRLVERRPQFGLGAAYGTTSPEHLLNVRAANMSAFTDKPLHFVEWLADRADKGLLGDAQAGGGGAAPNGGSFATRASYGEYLQSLLHQAVMTPAPAGRLILEGDAVVDARREGARWRIELAMGRTFEADALVLAIGNLPPHPPCTMAPEAEASDRYVADPWAWDPEQAPEHGTAVLLGSGLTMVDTALILAARRPELKLVALSRRGLLPLRHGPAAPAPAFETEPGVGLASMLRRLRAEALGQDWRTVVDSLRPQVQSIWRSWSPSARRRFLRHARPWWDIHRHRLSPPVAERIAALMEAGRLTVVPGRVLEIAPASGDTGGLEVSWRPRGSHERRHTAAALAINCTGPRGDLSSSAEPLLASLRRVGLIRPDACSLGIDVDSLARVIGGDGAATPALFAVGPITRGAFWEITSVPDIRIQAADCATHILETL